VENFLYQTTNIFGHSGREQQGLMLTGQASDNIADIGQKAHIEHTVGFINNEYLYPRQVKGAFQEMIQQTSGTAYNQFNSPAEAANLVLHVNPAVNGDSMQASLETKLIDCFAGLFRKFAGGGNDQDSDMSPGALH
jgi:hypothetical protein